MLDDLIKDFKKLIFDNASRFIKPEVAHKEAKPLNKIHLLESKDLKFTPPFKGSFYNIGNYSPGVATDKNHPRGHNGVDLYVSKDPGSPIYSIANGIVSQVADTPKGGTKTTKEGTVFKGTFLNGKLCENFDVEINWKDGSNNRGHHRRVRPVIKRPGAKFWPVQSQSLKEAAISNW